MHIIIQFKLEQVLKDSGKSVIGQNPSRFVGYSLISYGCFIQAYFNSKYV